MQAIPNDIIKLIIGLLSPQEAVSLTLVNKRLRSSYYHVHPPVICLKERSVKKNFVDFLRAYKLPLPKVSFKLLLETDQAVLAVRKEIMKNKLFVASVVELRINNINIDLITCCFPALKNLDLSWNREVTNDALGNFLKINTQLEKLILKHVGVSNLPLIKLPRLRELNLYWSENITNQSLQYFLQYNTQLEKLDLSMTEISNLPLIKMPRLTTLNLEDAAFITNDNINQFQERNPQVEIKISS